MGKGKAQGSSITHGCVGVTELLGVISHSDSIGHKNFFSGILWMSCIHWQWAMGLSELIQAFVNLQWGGERAVAWAFWSYCGESLTAKEETFLQKQNWNSLVVPLKIMFTFYVFPEGNEVIADIDCKLWLNSVFLFTAWETGAKAKGYAIQKTISENQRQTGNLLNLMSSLTLTCITTTVTLNFLKNSDSSGSPLSCSKYP